MYNTLSKISERNHEYMAGENRKLASQARAEEDVWSYICHCTTSMSGNYEPFTADRLIEKKFKKSVVNKVIKERLSTGELAKSFGGYIRCSY